MKLSLLIVFIALIFCFSCSESPKERYIFFLHNRFLEEHSINESHPEYGRTEYNEILSAFKKASFTVISEQRQSNVNARDYAEGIVAQINDLIKKGIHPKHITIIGTSKGGYIAQYVSTIAQNPDLNFVFIASFRTQDLETIPAINYCGNILNIYEETDPFGVSAIGRKETSTCAIRHYKDLQLHTGLRHGFLFKALDVWLQPSINWANGHYQNP